MSLSVFSALFSALVSSPSSAAPARWSRRVVVAPALALAACVFPMTQQDTAAHVHRMCIDRNYAYETGYNHGLQRGHLDTGWIDTSCAPERRDAIRSGFHEGYNTGIASAAPDPGAHARGARESRGTTRVVSSSASCTFSSDCDDGQTCRSNVCMGNGGAGDACWFSSDCLSGSCDARTCR